MNSYGREKRRSSAVLDRAVSKGNLSEVFRLGLKMFFFFFFFFGVHSRACWHAGYPIPSSEDVSSQRRLREQELTATLSARNSNRDNEKSSRILARYMRNGCGVFFCYIYSFWRCKSLRRWFFIKKCGGGNSKDPWYDLDMSLIFLLLVGFISDHSIFTSLKAVAVGRWQGCHLAGNYQWRWFDFRGWSRREGRHIHVLQFVLGKSCLGKPRDEA